MALLVSTLIINSASAEKYTCPLSALKSFIGNTPVRSRILQNVPDFGKTISKDDIETVRFLGEGSSSNVYLITPKPGKGEPFVIKRFKQTRKNKYHFGIDKEMERYKLFEDILEYAPESSIRPVRALRASDTDIRINWAKGETLEDILLNPDVPKVTKEKLVDNYNRGMEYIKEELEFRYPDYQIEYSRVPNPSGHEAIYLRIEDDPTNFGISIRPNQVVVDPSDGSLRLIDQW